MFSVANASDGTPPLLLLLLSVAPVDAFGWFGQHQELGMPGLPSISFIFPLPSNDLTTTPAYPDHLVRVRVRVRVRLTVIVTVTVTVMVTVRVTVTVTVTVRVRLRLGFGF
jgi:hypothetical protein